MGFWNVFRKFLRPIATKSIKIIMIMTNLSKTVKIRLFGFGRGILECFSQISLPDYNFECYNFFCSFCVFCAVILNKINPYLLTNFYQGSPLILECFLQISPPDYNLECWMFFCLLHVFLAVILNTINPYFLTIFFGSPPWPK